MKDNAEKVDLTIKYKKTKAVRPSSRDQQDIDIILQNLDTLDNVKKSVYLGSTVIYNGDLTQTINKRIL